MGGQYLSIVQVDVVMFALCDGDLLVLLKQPDRPGQALIPGEIVQRDEPLESTALRVLKGSGVSEMYLEQLYAYAPVVCATGERAAVVAYLALASAVSGIPRNNLAGGLAWRSVCHLPAMSSEQNGVIQYALQRLRYKLEYTAIGFRFLPAQFTLTEIQVVYEIILGETLDKRDFRRRILAADILEEAGRRNPGLGRPPRLYRFRQGAIAEAKARRLFP